MVAKGATRAGWAIVATLLLAACDPQSPSPTTTPGMSISPTVTAPDDLDGSDTPNPPGTPEAAPTAVPEDVTKACSSPTVQVGDADSLQQALDQAGPGTTIALAPGVYEGHFVMTTSGTADRPAALCGSVDAVLDGGSTGKGYVVHLDGAQHWVLSGFTVRNGQKGVMANGTVGSVIAGLQVHEIGDEAVHLRRESTDNLVIGNTISDTGNRKPKYGEGIYIGTANSNWCDVNNCAPDGSDRNQVIGNSIFDTTAESIDIKEGTVDGVVADNHFDGAGMTSTDSWVDVKGNDWTITGNVGVNAPLDGFQTHEVVDGWGTGNLFSDNAGSLTDEEGQLVSLNPVEGNSVSCSNNLTSSVGTLSEDGCTG